MKVCVFGAGAVGGHLAAKLAAAGHDVSVVARGAHLEAMRANGITLIHGRDTIRGRVVCHYPGDCRRGHYRNGLCLVPAC